ncbi:hypothetical protein ACFE04_011263 [Oxalis oulophora]
MGEAPAFIVDDLTTWVFNGFRFKSKANETTTVIGDKKYVICGTNDESILEVEVKIFDKTSGEWWPKAARGYSAIPINEDRILIIKKGSTSDDCIWFLEDFVPMVVLQLPTLEPPHWLAQCYLYLLNEQVILAYGAESNKAFAILGETTTMESDGGVVHFEDTESTAKTAAK